MKHGGCFRGALRDWKDMKAKLRRRLAPEIIQSKGGPFLWSGRGRAPAATIHLSRDTLVTIPSSECQFSDAPVVGRLLFSPAIKLSLMSPSFTIVRLCMLS
ncbi:hypothetical protein PGT21_000432 [Puccinia graminis f. sp. tritici]|uniref:Uncharacterized protein n=1 Tax=Puccinia graminis f. sp. tritici TaxID=56615 RepID=A0A5B0Q0N1_PUCGR|nr:hypothetical protein PGT21_000432 [Puccinia graminis f. sp. tritici]